MVLSLNLLIALDSSSLKSMTFFASPAIFAIKRSLMNCKRSFVNVLRSAPVLVSSEIILIMPFLSPSIIADESLERVSISVIPKRSLTSDSVISSEKDAIWSRIVNESLMLPSAARAIISRAESVAFILSALEINFNLSLIF